MAWIATAIAGSAVLGAAGSIYGANKQASAAQNALGMDQAIFNQINGNAQPYLQAGTAGANTLKSMIPQFSQSFTNADLNANLAPNYEFMLGQGQGQTEHALNASGGDMSGNTLQGLNTFTQNYADNAYQNAFNNWQTNQNSIYNRLSGIAGIGVNANNTVVGIGGQTQGNMGSVYGYQGNAQANGINGATNAIGGIPMQVAGMNYLNSFMPSNNGSGASSGAGGGTGIPGSAINYFNPGMSVTANPGAVG
jgi:hypothetical protein